MPAGFSPRWKVIFKFHVDGSCLVFVLRILRGTTAEALRAGIPQIACPFFFDQFYWSERMAWIGVAAQPIKAVYLMQYHDCAEELSEQSCVEKVCYALGEASCVDVTQRARDMGKIIRSESGVEVAVNIITATWSCFTEQEI